MNKEFVETIISDSNMYRKINTNINNVSIYSYSFFDPYEFKTLGEKYGYDIVSEIRGLTFVNNKPFPSVHKFFNIGENDLSITFDDLPENNIYVVDKLDGSLISPIIINNEIILKSKNSLSSPQALRANTLLTPNMRDKIKELINSGYYPQFEYVSPFNKIVVDYSKEELILIMVKKYKDGKFIVEDPNCLPEIANYIGVNYAESKYISKSELIDIVDNHEGIEGFIIYHNNNLYKIKTKWYIERHRLVPQNMSVKTIFEFILDEKIDDVINTISDNKLKEEILKFSHNVIDKINRDIDELSKIRTLIYEYQQKYGGFKEFAKDYPQYTKYIKTLKSNKSIKDIVVDMIRKQYKKTELIVKDFGNPISSINTFNVITKETIEYNIFGSRTSSDIDYDII